MFRLLHPAAQLLKLSVERLPVGADAGVADEAFFRISFRHILRQLQPLDRQGTSEFTESLDLWTGQLPDRLRSSVDARPNGKVAPIPDVSGAKCNW
jgi:hypothetical protein